MSDKKVFCLNCKYSIGRDPSGSKPTHPIHVWCLQHLEYRKPDDSCELGEE